MLLRDCTKSTPRSRVAAAHASLVHLRRARLAVGLALFAVAAPACTREVGDCDSEAARELVYGQNGLVATKGQALLHDACGNAAFCHSSAASGEQRYGAPRSLNFDMLPVPTGWSAVIEHRDAIWTSVLKGDMPPSGSGQRAIGDGDWTTDPYRREGSERLPSLETEAGQAALRNWLACGAPVVGDTQAPGWALPPGEVDGDASWNDIYTAIIAPKCATAGCHNAFAAGDLALTDACKAYRQLLSPASAACGGEPRLVPADESSLLLDKIASREPRCGGPMPTSGPLPAADVETIRAWIERGAPADCP